jgi:hypothetical protein
MRNRLEKVFLLDVGIWILTGCGAPKDRNAFLQHLENSIARCVEKGLARSCEIVPKTFLGSIRLQTEVKKLDEDIDRLYS